MSFTNMITMKMPRVSKFFCNINRFALFSFYAIFFLIQMIFYCAVAFGVKIYKPTRECSMAGGICVSENDCAQDQLTQRRGLCSEPNVECCYDGNINIFFWFVVDFEFLITKIR